MAATRNARLDIIIDIHEPADDTDIDAESRLVLPDITQTSDGLVAGTSQEYVSRPADTLSVPKDLAENKNADNSVKTPKKSLWKKKVKNIRKKVVPSAGDGDPDGEQQTPDDDDAARRQMTFDLGVEMVKSLESQLPPIRTHGRYCGFHYI